MTGAPDADPRLSLLRYIGLRVTVAEPDLAVVEIELRPDLRNRAGILQGGLIATLIDVAAGVVAARAADAETVVTADMTIHYLAPARVGPIRATGRVLRAGRTQVVTEVRVTDVGNDDRLCSHGTVTLAVLPPVPPAGEAAAEAATD